MRTGEQEPGDGELVKFAAITSVAATFDAKAFDAATFEKTTFEPVAFSAFEHGSRDAVECGVTQCNVTGGRDVTERCNVTDGNRSVAVRGNGVGSRRGHVRCGDSVNVGCGNPIEVVAATNERSPSSIARAGRARCTGLSHPELAPIEFEGPFGSELMCPELPIYLRCKSLEGAINLRTVL